MTLLRVTHEPADVHHSMLDVRAHDRLHPVEQRRPGIRRLFGALWQLARQSPLATIAAALLAIDFAFIAIQIAVDATDYGFNGAYRLSLETEMGVAQVYGFIKIGAAAYLLGTAWRRFRSPTALLWTAALVYLGLDDALRFHESIGTSISNALELGEIGPLRGQDLGELVFYFIVMATALGALVLAEWKDRGPTPTILTTVMTPIVGVFLFFAVVVDTIGGVLPQVLQIAVEDGGELVALTAIFIAAVLWTERSDELAELSSG